MTRRKFTKLLNLLDTYKLNIVVELPETNIIGERKDCGIVRIMHKDGTKTQECIRFCLTNLDARASYRVFNQVLEYVHNLDVEIHHTCKIVEKGKHPHITKNSPVYKEFLDLYGITWEENE